MKHLPTGWMLAAVLALHARGAAGAGNRLAVAIEPRFAGAPLAFDVVTNLTASGQRVSVTRLDFLLSNIALRRADGAWLGLTNWFAFVSAREGRTGFELNSIPAGRYERIRFQVGVPYEMNHADPAPFPATHPLNPNVNGLHWSWQGGYVFFAIEGSWRNDALPPEDPASFPSRSNAELAARPPTEEGAGYSFHIADDPHLMTVELPIELDLAASRELTLELDVAKVFAGAETIPLSHATASTHSRKGDELADRLRRNIERAWAVGVVRSLPPSGRDWAGASGLAERKETREGSIRLVASNATPYRLVFSRLFPQPVLPEDNPLTEEGVHLGRLLFLDPRLSRNNRQACAACHQLEAGFTDPGNAVSRGAEGQTGTRNAMPLFNLAWKSAFFWDGRTQTLREQVLQPVQNPVEMHETIENVVAKLQFSRVNSRHVARALELAVRLAPGQTDAGLIPSAAADAPNDYLGLFARAFGSPEITPDRVARALEQFLLTLASHTSKFDRVVAGQAEFTSDEKRGFELFHTEYDPRRSQFGADCFHCHGGPLFQNVAFANNGLDGESRDLGRFLATGKPGDRGKFAVPSLRNVALTAPYMHDGRFGTLEEVIAHYSAGVRRSPTLDPNLAKHPGRGVALSPADQSALVAFLKTLTDERFAK